MRTLSALSLAFILAASVAAAPVLTLSPSSGAIGGIPGSTVGWGFTITNTTNFLLVTGSSFTPVSGLGTYDDYIGSSSTLVVVGPAPESPSVSESFDSVARTGVGAFHINANAPTGISILGNLVINYGLFSRSPNDPNFDPDTDTITADATLSQAVSISSVPEPESLLLITAALPAAFVIRRRLVA